MVWSRWPGAAAASTDEKIMWCFCIIRYTHTHTYTGQWEREVRKSPKGNLAGCNEECESPQERREREREDIALCARVAPVGPPHILGRALYLFLLWPYIYIYVPLKRVVSRPRRRPQSSTSLLILIHIYIYSLSPLAPRRLSSLLLLLPADKKLISVLLLLFFILLNIYNWSIFLTNFYLFLFFVSGEFSFL